MATGLTDVRSGKRKARLRLLAPVRYLTIRNPEKNVYDFLVPTIVAALFCIGYVLLTPKPPIFGENGILKFTRDLLVMGVPFMVGALASVAMGSPGHHLDKRPVGAELVLDGETLTLRQFVCYLLGYLTFLGIVTLVSSVAAPLARDAIVRMVGSGQLHFVVFHAGVAVLFTLLASLLVTVLWSLYFLTEVVNAKPTKE